LSIIVSHSLSGVDRAAFALRPAPTGQSGSDECRLQAIGVSWYDAVAYCNWLSEQEGLAQDEWCYVPNDKGLYAEGMTIPADFLRALRKNKSALAIPPRFARHFNNYAATPRTQRSLPIADALTWRHHAVAALWSAFALTDFFATDITNQRLRARQFNVGDSGT
jgi:hypothetical protein